MKKIIQYSLYALMACGFMEAHAADMSQPEPQSAAAPGQTASEQRLAEIKASLPSVIDAYDALLNHSADNTAYSILYGFVMRLKECSEWEISKVRGMFLDIKVEMREKAARQLVEQSMLPDNWEHCYKPEYCELIDSSRVSWGELPKKRTIAEWGRLFTTVTNTANLVGTLAHGNDCLISIDSENYTMPSYMPYMYCYGERYEYQVGSNLVSILSSQGKRIPEIFPDGVVCFHLTPMGSFKTKGDYENQIQELNELCRSCAAKIITISIDGEESAELLSGKLHLPDDITVNISIEGTSSHIVGVTSELLNKISGQNIDDLYLCNAVLEDGVALCDFLRSHKVRGLTLHSVDPSKVLRDAEKIGALLSNTPIKTFLDLHPRVSGVDLVANTNFWVDHLPENIKSLSFNIDGVPVETAREIIRKALKRYPNMNYSSFPYELSYYDLETLAYMALHPSLSCGCFARGEEELKSSIRSAGMVIADIDADAILNVLMAFRKYRHILNDPYRHVDLLIKTLKTLCSLRDSNYSILPDIDRLIARDFIDATSRFRKAVMKKRDEFSVRFRFNENTTQDEIIRINDEFRQFVQQQYDSMLESLKSRLPQLFSNDETDNNADMTAPESKK